MRSCIIILSICLAQTWCAMPLYGLLRNNWSWVPNPILWFLIFKSCIRRLILFRCLLPLHFHHGGSLIPFQFQAMGITHSYSIPVSSMPWGTIHSYSNPTPSSPSFVLQLLGQAIPTPTKPLSCAFTPQYPDVVQILHHVHNASATLQHNVGCSAQFPLCHNLGVHNKLQLISKHTMHRMPCLLLH